MVVTAKDEGDDIRTVSPVSMGGIGENVRSVLTIGSALRTGGGVAGSIIQGLSKRTSKALNNEARILAIGGSGSLTASICGGGGLALDMGGSGAGRGFVDTTAATGGVSIFFSIEVTFGARFGFGFSATASLSFTGTSSGSSFSMCGLDRCPSSRAR